MNLCAWHILRFGQWAKPGPLLLCLLFKCLCTTLAPGVSLSHSRRTASGKLPVLPDFSGFLSWSIVVFISFFPAADWFSEWRCLTVDHHLQKTHFILTGRQRWDGKMKVRQKVSFIVSLNSQVCHTPLNPLKASQRLSVWDSLVNSCTWPFTPKNVCTCWCTFPQRVSCMSIASAWQVSGSIRIHVSNIFSQLLSLTWCSIPVWMTLVVSELHRRWPRMMVMMHLWQWREVNPVILHSISLFSVLSVMCYFHFLLN